MYEGWAYFLDDPKNFIYENITPHAVYEVDPEDNNPALSIEGRDASEVKEVDFVEAI